MIDSASVILAVIHMDKDAMTAMPEEGFNWINTVSRIYTVFIYR